MLSVLCMIFAVFVVFCVWVILYDTHHFVVVRHTFSSDKIKKPVRMVMLSDLHNYKYGKENVQLLTAIEKEKPDMIVIAGDMITAKKKEKFDSTLALLGKLKECYPVYYAYGNHEQKISLYAERYGDMGKRFEKGLSEKKIEPLRNAHCTLQDANITIYGLEIEHEYFQRYTTKPMPEAYLEEKLGKADKSSFCVLLAHNPDYFPKYAKWGADLVLSGHVHGGIIRVPFLGGFVSPAVRFFPKYDGGLFREGDADMVLGRGIGTHSPNIRLFNPAELLVIDLSSPKESLEMEKKSR